MQLKSFIKDFHWALFFIALLLSVSGLVVIASASSSLNVDYVHKQLIWIGVGILFMFIILVLGYRPFLNLSYVLYAISIALLLLVLITGVVRQGAQRWLHLGFIALQPSEFCKLATILALAHYLGGKKPTQDHRVSFFIASLIVLFPLAFIVKQPDLGTALIFVPIYFCMLFVWGAKLRYLIGTILTGLISMPIFWFMLKEYQKRRLLVFINPNIDPLGSGYSAIQSKIAVGSGMITGKGWQEGTQSQLQFLPERHTDFIFSVIGEEWGFLGAVSIVLLYLIFFWCAVSIAHQTTDVSGRILVVGVVSMIAFQVFVNIGMTIGYMPITGLPLPFISYGGSSIISMFISLGLLLSIHRNRSIF